jgi:nitric oxide reductase NorD protein
MERAALSANEIGQQLDVVLETEFTFHKVTDIADRLALLDRDAQDFILDWIRRIATTHITLAHRFGKLAPEILQRMDQRAIEAWAVHLCDIYDQAGMYAALEVVENAGRFTQHRHEHAAGALFEDSAPVLANFVHGLSGRRLKVEQGETAWTDGEKIVLPGIVAAFASRADNFKLTKAMTAFLWAQTRFGSLRAEAGSVCANYPDPDRALAQFHGLETLRLGKHLARELPGLHRDMQRLGAELGDRLAGGWAELAARIDDHATLEDSLGLLDEAVRLPDFLPFCYQGALNPEAVAAARAGRLDKEKARLRVKLADMAEEQRRRAPESGAEPDAPPRFEATPDEAEGRLDFEITLDGMPVVPPDDVKQLLTSIFLDFGEIPPEYLVPAGDGEYAPNLYQDQPADPDAVWQGTYHEEGALFYPEWDLGRQHYRKNWCVMREKEVKPVYDDFPQRTLAKYGMLVKQLRQRFEAMRDENRLLKRQTQGDEVDLDALVEALADARDGSEMNDRLFMHMHRAERNIAVAFMVDMSGSTKGWINEAEREALLLLCEALEKLGDRYAIYGFSGITRKRCELFRIKTFVEPYSAEVRARISGIAPQEYTRMGFAIRHLSKLLNEVEARTRILITLSDGRPDDYFDSYRGPYGIEDTRMALQEARRAGIHPFCITIDKDARDYLPHMYGAARYVILDDVAQLPAKVADIYRRLTH